MKPKFKTVHRSFNYLHCDDFAQYLESMAAKGWHLDSWGAGLKFRRGEPEQATYAVEVFTDASGPAAAGSKFLRFLKIATPLDNIECR